MEENVTLLAAFGAGLLSFISPCVLPLIPGYLSYISGLSLDEMRGTPAVAGGSAIAVARTVAARRQVVLSSLAFIFGVAPLVVATGAGSEMRQSLGTAVFSGMLGVTAFGLLFTPAFYTVARKLGRKQIPKARQGSKEKEEVARAA